MSLKVEHLTKSFGTKVAVNDLSFEMQNPGVFGLIGTNGAGKTTTIRNILGIMTPDRGNAFWKGQRITRESLNFGYMPEERGIYMKTNVLEQLIYFGMLRGMKKAAAKSSALNYLEKLELTEYKNMPAEKLSKGNQQKVQLAVTLLHQPELIFLDEPFSGLDPLNTEVLRQMLGDLVKEGKYIVMSSHQMSIVEEYCEELVILTQGKAVLNGNLRQIKAEYGHTNLIISCEQDISEIAKSCGLCKMDERAAETEYKITGDDMAEGFLKKLITADIYPLKYEIKEPSLQEIFVEKVGGVK